MIFLRVLSVRVMRLRKFCVQSVAPLELGVCALREGAKDCAHVVHVLHAKLGAGHVGVEFEDRCRCRAHLERVGQSKKAGFT
jgi:hypothetical protein